MEERSRERERSCESAFEVPVISFQMLAACLLAKEKGLPATPQVASTISAPFEV